MNYTQGPTRCPNCLGNAVEVFHIARSVPTNSCILLETRKEALNYPLGNIELGFCAACGFVSNTVFDPVLTEYSGRYEETQGYSPTFQLFHRDLADRLIAKFNLHDREILEIGCGKGEFLLLLCDNGKNRGTGYDPAYRADRFAPSPNENIRFVPDFYTEKCTETAADFVCCKMTLEHIPQTHEFMRMIRKAQGERPADIFFMIPDATRILQNCVFEDIYYEHCSYFSPYSLERLFRSAGFFPAEIGTEYDGQYLTISASTNDGGHGPLSDPEQLKVLTRWVEHFPVLFNAQLEFWRSQRDNWREHGSRVVIWGSGSKGVSFLTTLKLDDGIAGAVDINPHRQGYFMPGSGHRILSPDELVELKPDVVIVMNPIYRREIAADLAQRGLAPEILAVDDGVKHWRETS